MLHCRPIQCNCISNTLKKEWSSEQVRGYAKIQTVPRKQRQSQKYIQRQRSPSSFFAVLE